MKLKRTLPFSWLLLVGAGTAAQTTANHVTEVVTTFGGYWRSGTGTAPNAALSTTKPNNSHLLLAFTLNGTRYATGINNGLLDANGLAGYTAAPFQGLTPAGPTSTPTGSTKITLGQLYDGVNNGPSVPPPANGYPTYLADGTQGLDLGTGVANLTAGTYSFDLRPVKAAAIGDGVPDVLVSQIAAAGANDQYRFVDAGGAVVGNALTISMSSVPAIGNWTADFYEASQAPMTLASSLTASDRPLRLWAADFAAFGIAPADYARLARFQLLLGGDSDPAFVAYNTNSSTAAGASTGPLPVVLAAFAGVADGAEALLRWQTASEHNARAFVVEASADGRTFAAVGEVAAAGSSPEPRHYQFRHAPARPGLHYYRLHQLDADGTGTYSGVVAVRLGAAALEAFPSPFDKELTLRLPAAARLDVALFAADGRPVLARTLPGAAAQELPLPEAAGLAPGLYLLRVVADGQASTRRVQKQ